MGTGLRISLIINKLSQIIGLKISLNTLFLESKQPSKKIIGARLEYLSLDITFCPQNGASKA